jgi:hypothetical protein
MLNVVGPVWGNRAAPRASSPGKCTDTVLPSWVRLLPPQTALNSVHAPAHSLRVFQPLNGTHSSPPEIVEVRSGASPDHKGQRWGV